MPASQAIGREPTILADGRRDIEEALYRECARILGAVHVYKPWIGPAPNRWNNRHAGNGRFLGFGTIRMHAPDQIHVALRRPVPLTRSCRSPEDVFRLLRRVMRASGARSRDIAKPHQG